MIKCQRKINKKKEDDDDNDQALCNQLRVYNNKHQKNRGKKYYKTLNDFFSSFGGEIQIWHRKWLITCKLGPLMI